MRDEKHEKSYKKCFLQTILALAQRLSHQSVSCSVCLTHSFLFSSLLEIKTLNEWTFDIERVGEKGTWDKMHRLNESVKALWVEKLVLPNVNLISTAFRKRWTTTLMGSDEQPPTPFDFLTSKILLQLFKLFVVLRNLFTTIEAIYGQCWSNERHLSRCQRESTVLIAISHTKPATWTASRCFI